MKNALEEMQKHVERICEILEAAPLPNTENSRNAARDIGGNLSMIKDHMEKIYFDVQFPDVSSLCGKKYPIDARYYVTLCPRPGWPGTTDFFLCQAGSHEKRLLFSRANIEAAEAAALATSYAPHLIPGRFPAAENLQAFESAETVKRFLSTCYGKED